MNEKMTLTISMHRARSFGKKYPETKTAKIGPIFRNSDTSAIGSYLTMKKAIDCTNCIQTSVVMSLRMLVLRGKRTFDVYIYSDLIFFFVE